ncbi:coiled-coil domain-containing protein 150 isoform X1 [Heterodontus francisci]|uniref:coiled-coil domain-containing protein 150 isoform X1 n=1 Tax=Heterodontus francisci TaxID=7792 RepID=UPI00355B66E2
MTTDILNMSHAPIPPIHVGATAPESFTVLQRRIIAAEEQTVALFQELEGLGFGIEDTGVSKIGDHDSHRPVSPFHARKAFGTENDVLWKNYESLVSRVCRLESVIQTMKLNVFRIQTAKELNPEHSVDRLAAMQEEHVQELKKMQREIMRFRQQLSEVSEEKEAAQEEIEKLSAALEMATATKTDVAVAAEELKATKSRMSRRLQELKKELVQEMSLRKALEESHIHLLQRVQDMDKAVEVERKQVKVLQQDILTLRNDGQIIQERLQHEQQKTNDLEKMHKQLKIESDAKESIISQMADEGKQTQLMLNKQQQENANLRSEIASMKDVAEKVQALNDQLDTQCTELSGALRSISMENAKLIIEHQASLKAEQEKMKEKLQEQDFLLESARASISAELQSAMNEKQQLKNELEALRLEHTEIKQKFETTEEKATAQKMLLESVIAHLKVDLKAAVNECENIKQEKDSLLDQTNNRIDKITEENNIFEKQLSESQLKVSSLTAALKKQEKENGYLVERLAALEHQQHAQQQVEHVLAEITESKNKLAYDKGRLQARVEQLQEELQCMLNANSENVQLRKFNTVLETKYTQINAEFSTFKINLQRLETQFRQAQLVLEQKEEDFAMAIKSRDEALQEIQKLKERIEMMEERETQKIANLQQNLSDSKEDNSQMAVTVENVLVSHTKLQQTVEKLQIELGQRDTEINYLQRDKSHTQMILQRLQAELGDLQHKLASIETQHNIQVTPLRKGLEIARQDNKKLARSLEQTLHASNTLQIKLNQLQEELDNKQQQQLLHSREQELEDAKIESKMFTEQIDALKKQYQSEREIARKASQKEIMELRKSLADTTSKSAELSRANRELRLKVAEFEKTIKSQKAKIKDQKTQLKHHLETKANNAQNTERMKEFEADLERMEAIKELYQKKNYEQSQMIQKFMTEMQSLQEELQNVAKSQHEAASLRKQQEFQLKKEHKLSQELRSKCQTLEAKVKSLQTCKEITEQKLKEASLESQQVSANLEEAHQWFKSKFDRLQAELIKIRGMDPPKEELCDGDNLMKTGIGELCSRSRQRAKDEKVTTVKIPSQSSLSRWETKQELKLLSRKYHADMPK